MKISNIFENIPQTLKEELIENILVNNNFKVERIISEAHASPKEFWYDQPTNEFIYLVSVSAAIMFEDHSVKTLKTGDYLVIEAGKKHRVEWTDKKSKTIWLTIHYKK